MKSAQEYINAWAEMNNELEKDLPGISLDVPDVERTQAWIDESKAKALLDSAADLLGGSLTHQLLVDSRGNESKRYIIAYK